VFCKLRVRREGVLRAFPENDGATEDPSVAHRDLKAVLREAMGKNPKLTQVEAGEIAWEIEPREKISQMHRSLGASTKPGQHGPGINRVGPAAQFRATAHCDNIGRVRSLDDHLGCGGSRGICSGKHHQQKPTTRRASAVILSLQRTDRPSHQKHVAFLMPVAPSAFPGRCSTSSLARATSSRRSSPHAGRTVVPETEIDRLTTEGAA
jgi:hypothetical protein